MNALTGPIEQRVNVVRGHYDTQASFNNISRSEADKNIILYAKTNYDKEVESGEISREDADTAIRKLRSLLYRSKQSSKQGSKIGVGTRSSRVGGKKSNKKIRKRTVKRKM
jgi:hypothetical protein